MSDSYKYRKNDTKNDISKTRAMKVKKLRYSSNRTDWRTIFSRYAKFARPLMERIHHCNS